ncbi:MAG: cell envelope integrity protein TolA [Gammaproteobacteria bacterium]|nr:cell envelope integrity protein TolA [Gammaproteobacteria bacterium]
MIRTVLGLGCVILGCIPALADWEAGNPELTVTPLSGPAVGTTDPRGNSFLLQKDPAGTIVGILMLNAFLPEPDPIGGATPVLFSIDGKEAQAIREGKWERADLYRKLVFSVNGALEAGLSESFIDILEGARITFKYPAGSIGYESVSFSLRDSGGVLARTLGIETPIDHDRERGLREARSRVIEEQRALLLTPVDPAVEEARRALIGRQLELIRARVLDRWMRPARWSGLRCTLRITLMSTGNVLHVAVIKGSGDADFDASMAAAVRDASPLPLPADKALFGSFQLLEMVFEPADEGGDRLFSQT